MEVILVRHTSVDVPKGTCYGWSDVPVRKTFEQEAAVTAQHLARYQLFDAVFTSPLTRARKLSAYCGYPDATVDDRLKEMNMGDWEMRLYEEIEQTDPAIRLWYDDYMHLAATNGESFAVFYDRIAGFLDQLKQQAHRRVAIFAHGGVLICAGIYGGLFVREGAFEHLVDYGAIERIEI